MILCDFYDLNREEFHMKFYETVVNGNIELITEILEHPKLSKQFDISHNNYYCIMAAIFNSQRINDCHLELLKLFTQSPLLKKHADPSLCSQEDILGGALGNAIVFTPIETVRFIGTFFNDKTSNLKDLIALSVFNNKKEAFFYLVEERKFTPKSPESLLKALSQFPQTDASIVEYIENLVKSPVSDKSGDTSTVLDNHQLNSINKTVLNNDYRQKNNSTGMFSKSNDKTNSSKTATIHKKTGESHTILLNLSNLKPQTKSPSWGSRFRQNF